jgi:hypothetical protein
MSRKIGFWPGVAVFAFRAHAGAQETCKTIVAAERTKYGFYPAYGCGVTGFRVEARTGSLA